MRAVILPPFAPAIQKYVWQVAAFGRWPSCARAVPRALPFVDIRGPLVLAFFETSLRGTAKIPWLKFPNYAAR